MSKQLSAARLTRIATAAAWSVFLNLNVADAAWIDCSNATYHITVNTTLSGVDGIRCTTSNCLNHPCVDITGGKKLDLNQLPIVCTASECAEAVVGLAAGTTLENGTVSGPFLSGAYDVEEVRNTTIDGPGAGISGALFKRAHGNVLRNLVSGISLCVDSSLAYVHDNAIESSRSDAYGYTYNAIYACATSGSGPRVADNLIRDWHGSHWNAYLNGGIFLSNAYGTNLRLSGNILIDVSGDHIIGKNTSVTPTTSDNICDDATYCPPSVPPFAVGTF
jgi:hypothetical protein